MQIPPDMTFRPTDTRLVEAILMLVTAVNQNTEAVLALADATAGVEEVKEEGGSPYLDGP